MHKARNKDKIVFLMAKPIIFTWNLEIQGETSHWISS